MTDKGARSVGFGFRNSHVAVVGSGPSGFYVTEALLRSDPSLQVDMFERLPVPFGLVRFGVAPDHPKLKQVTTVYQKIAAMPGFRFFGGVELGRDVAVDELRASYAATILATGADVSRALNIPGEHLAGSHAAGDFVAWYNGHPEYGDRAFDLNCTSAVIIGHGNVALDVARILAKAPDELRRTDIASHALEVLAESRLEEIYLVGRGSPSQAKFTAKELHEFVCLESCDVTFDPHGFQTDELECAVVQDTELAEKLDAFRKIMHKEGDKPRRSVFRFGLSPVSLWGEGRLKGVSFERAGSRAIEHIECGLVFTSVGRSARPLPGVPYDELRGVHANVEGCVAPGTSLLGGLYACGWSKRGASGTIGTNRACGTATAERVLADLCMRDVSPLVERDAFLARLHGRVTQIVSFSDWLAIDALERRNGTRLEKPREKLASISEMLAAARAGQQSTTL